MEYMKYVVIECKRNVGEKQIKTTLIFKKQTNSNYKNRSWGFKELWQGKYKANKVTCNYILF